MRRLKYTGLFRGCSGFDEPTALENDLSKRWMKAVGPLALTLFAIAAGAAPEPRYNPEAIRLNNRGVALMGQQFTEKAADSFAEAFKKDPKLAQASINDGIALMTLQKLDDAKKAFKDAIALDPKSAQVWYNLGLAQHAENELEAALASFQQAVKLDPRDADSYYFEGVCYREMKQFDKAIESLKQALAINPLHASSEFAMARVLQGMGKKDEAKEHFKLFQHMTSTKISAAIGLAYGEQGHYSTVTPVEEPQARQKNMIAVKARSKGHDRGEGCSGRDRRGLHAGCDRLRTDGPCPHGIRAAGHSCASSA